MRVLDHKQVETKPKTQVSLELTYEEMEALRRWYLRETTSSMAEKSYRQSYQVRKLVEAIFNYRD